MASAVSSWSSTIYAPSGFFGSNAGFSQRLRLTDRQVCSTRAEVTSAPSTTSPKKGKGISKKPKVMLRFVWMDKNIGIGLDQVVPGHGTVPLSSYYFWPRKDAWEEIKTKLEGKKWISRKQTILLLNQATDVINLWQQNATV